MNTSNETLLDRAASAVNAGNHRGASALIDQLDKSVPLTDPEKEALKKISRQIGPDPAAWGVLIATLLVMLLIVFKVLL